MAHKNKLLLSRYLLTTHEGCETEKQTERQNEIFNFFAPTRDAIPIHRRCKTFLSAAQINSL